MLFSKIKRVILSAGEKGQIAIVVCTAFLIRLVNINMPILEGTAARQVQTAGIARFFYNHGFDILHSRLDHVAGEGGYLVLEFPLYNMILALLYKISGGVHEWIGRLLSIFFFIGAGLFVYMIIKRFYDHKTAIIGALVFYFSPLGIIFSRTIMPDSMMLFFSTGSIFFMIFFVLGGKRWGFWASALFAMISLMVKIQSFYILLPLLFLVLFKQRHKCFFDYKNYLFFLIAVLPAIIWYALGASAHKVITPDRILNYKIANWFNPALFLSPKLYIDILKISSGVLLTPVGFAIFLLGIFVAPRERIESVCYAWLAGVILFACAFNALLWEPYYYLSFLPVASIFIARAFMLDWKTVFKKTFLVTKTGKIFILFLLMLFIGRYALYAYMIPEGYRFIPEIATAARTISAPGDELVVSACPGSSAILYYSGRKGFFLLPPVKDKPGQVASFVDELGGMKDKGARYFVSADEGVFSYDSLHPYLDREYKIVDRKENKYYIYEL